MSKEDALTNTWGKLLAGIHFAYQAEINRKEKHLNARPQTRTQKHKRKNKRKNTQTQKHTRTHQNEEKKLFFDDNEINCLSL